MLYLSEPIEYDDGVFYCMVFADTNEELTKASWDLQGHGDHLMLDKQAPFFYVTKAHGDKITGITHITEMGVKTIVERWRDVNFMEAKQAEKAKPEENHGERAHHKTSPSSLQAREACTHYEPSSGVSAAAEAGTRQHEACERRDISGLPTDEEATAVTKCLEFTNSIEQRFALIAEDSGERYIHHNEIYVHVDDDDTSSGYLDEAFVCNTSGALIDYKFGLWEVEPAENNLQAFAYTLGLFNLYPKLETVDVYFVMPYLDIIETHTFKRSDVPDMLLRIRTVVARSVAKTGEPTPNFLGCYSCAKKAECAALAKIAVKASEKFAPLQVPTEFDPMRVSDPADAVKGFRLATIMKAWSDSYKGRISNLAVEDERFIPPGYRIQSSQDRVITDAKAAFQVLKCIIPEDKLWEGVIKLGISNVEKIVKESAPRGEKTAKAEEVVGILTEKNLIALEEAKVYLKPMPKAKDSD